MKLFYIQNVGNNLYTKICLLCLLNRCAYSCYVLSGKEWFDGVIYFLILLNMVPVVWETRLIVDENHIFTFDETLMFVLANTVFVILFIIEFLIKVHWILTANKKLLSI